MNTPLRILQLEDDPTQVALVRATLEARLRPRGRGGADEG